MESYKFTGKLGELIEKAEHGSDLDVDYIMSHLTDDSSLAMTRYVDYALSLVENPNGIKRLEYFYLMELKFNVIMLHCSSIEG